MRYALALFLGLMACQSHGPPQSSKIAGDQGLDGKKIVFKGPCFLSKNPSNVYVKVHYGKVLLVELPPAYRKGNQKKLADGELKSWIAIDGTIRMIPRGGPETAERWDGHIQVDRFLYYGNRPHGVSSVLHVED